MKQEVQSRVFREGFGLAKEQKYKKARKREEWFSRRGQESSQAQGRTVKVHSSQAGSCSVGQNLVKKEYMNYFRTYGLIQTVFKEENNRNKLSSAMIGSRRLQSKSIKLRFASDGTCQNRSLGNELACSHNQKIYNFPHYNRLIIQHCNFKPWD